MGKNMRNIPWIDYIKLILMSLWAKKKLQIPAFFWMHLKLPELNTSIDFCDACNVAHIQCNAWNYAQNQISLAGLKWAKVVMKFTELSSYLPAPQALNNNFTARNIALELWSVSSRICPFIHCTSLSIKLYTLFQYGWGSATGLPHVHKV